MNPFERYQEMKPQIERDEAIMRNLKMYAFNENSSLVHLGRYPDTTNTHYRIGKVGDLWLATREILQFAPELQKECCETYIDMLLHQDRLLPYDGSGGRVSRIVGGVKAIAANRRGATDTIDRYFLLVEDLTAGGTADFLPGIKKDVWFGTVNGKIVFYDFPEYTKSNPEPFKYMTEENMIKLER